MTNTTTSLTSPETVLAFLSEGNTPIAELLVGDLQTPFADQVRLIIDLIDNPTESVHHQCCECLVPEEDPECPDCAEVRHCAACSEIGVTSVADELMAVVDALETSDDIESARSEMVRLAVALRAFSTDCEGAV